jgi:hypothetical protein
LTERATGASGFMSEMMATASPTGTSSPASASVAASQPLRPASTSIVLLSVSTSNRISSASTASPGAFSQLTSRPAVLRHAQLRHGDGMALGQVVAAVDGRPLGSAWRVGTAVILRAVGNARDDLAHGHILALAVGDADRKPSAGLSTSITALSVSTSNSASPLATASPGT